MTTWDEIYRSGRAMRYWPSEDVVRFCARRLHQTMAVLEVGCGNGANLSLLTQSGFETWAVDSSTEAIRLARLGNRSAVVEGAQLGALKAWAAGRVFDAIIDCRVSQHTPWSQHLAIYREYADLLRPGGWLFLLHLDDGTFPDAQQVDRQTSHESWTWDEITAGVYPQNGLVCMPPSGELERQVRGAGLVVERTEQVTRRENGWLTASHTAIDARKPG